MRGAVRAPGTVIYNGVDLAEFTPDGPHERPAEQLRASWWWKGTSTAAWRWGWKTPSSWRARWHQRAASGLELWVAGEVRPGADAEMEARAPGLVHWLGVVRREQIPSLDRSAHLLFSAELNPPCPNSVIEALACGLPVVGFASRRAARAGGGDAGRMVPWGSNVWKLEPPDLQGLAAAALPMLDEQERFRAAARARAESAFGLDRMVEKYLEVLM